MNNTAIEYTARLAAGHRAEVAADIAAARSARRLRNTHEPTVTEILPRRHGAWSRWLPALHPAH